MMDGKADIAERMAKIMVDLARADRPCTDADLAEAGFNESEITRYRPLASGYASVELRVSRR
jgi:hypothetical protein